MRALANISFVDKMALTHDDSFNAMKDVIDRANQLGDAKLMELIFLLCQDLDAQHDFTNRLAARINKRRELK